MNIGFFFIILFFGGWIGGKIATALKLPPVLGMLLVGMGIGNLFPGSAPGIMQELDPFLKTMALVIILLRAGLGLKYQDLRSLGFRSLVLGFLPGFLEATALTLTLALVLGWAWAEALTAGILLAAVSPAVVVPAMLDIRERGLDNKKNIPTLILASSSLDNVLVITAFSLVTRGPSVDPFGMSVWAIVPLTLVASLVPGILLGLFLAWIFNKFYKKIRATEKSLVLIFTALFLTQIGILISASAILGIMACALILLDRSPVAAAETAQKLAKVWVGAEILLFMLIGMAVNIPRGIEFLGTGLLLVGAGMLIRGLGSLLATAYSNLSFKERLFCVLAGIPKATVQAALGSVALSMGMGHGEQIQSLAVIAILVTSPLGLIAVNWGRRHLLDTEQAK